MCCRASSGSAPEVGTLLQSGVSLTGPCLARGEIMLSNDTDRNRWLDSQLCKETGIRSVLALPIKRDAKVIGVLEVVSTKRNAFNQHDAEAMRELGDQVVPLLSESAWIKAHSSGQEPSKLLRNSHERRLGKSIAGMSIVTVLAAVVILAPIVNRYSRRHPGGAPHVAVVPTMVPKHEPVIPQQHVATEQANTASGQSKPLDSVLTASRGEVLLAIQDLVQARDVNGILKQANRGDSIAQYEMAVRYADGEGVPQNYPDAMRWFAQAAARGHAKAQWKLGLGYLKGIGVPQDEGKAVLWFKRAANNGDVRAQTALSDIYLSGRGVPRDYVRAYTWANIAAGLQGDGHKRLEVIRSRMTAAEIADAERRTSIWREYASRRAGNPASSGS